MAQQKAINVALVCAGKYHDIDFARLELLKLLHEHEPVRVEVFSDYALGDALDTMDCLVSYTCDVVASDAETAALQRWLQGGGRWFALHGTNSVIEFASTKPLKIATPDRAAGFMNLLGSQFQAHPPIGEFDVHVAEHDAVLTDGVGHFKTTDELYLCQLRGDVETLLYCEYDGELPEFEGTDWRATQRQPILYRRRQGDGEVVYLTLGHSRGHYDMQPLMDYYPAVERGSWETPEYYQLLRNGIRWATQLSTDR
ncbi:MAG: ThuA domain-containing protein [Pseudomonadota bacterium]